MGARLLLDMDGTLINSFPKNILSINYAMRELGRKEVLPIEAKEVFQTWSYKQIWLDLGMPESYTKDANALFLEHYRSAQVPDLVPGTKPFLKDVTYADPGVVTHEVGKYAHQTLNHYRIHDLITGIRALQNSDGTNRCKSTVVIEDARKHPEDMIFYVGDLVSDGEAMLKARNEVDNVMFIGLAHSYAFNTPAMLQDFAQENSEVARVASSLEAIPEIMNDF